MSGTLGQFPLIKLQPSELVTIWGILNRYPQYLSQRYGIHLKVFGISVHPSVGVHGLLVDVLGAEPGKAVV